MLKRGVYAVSMIVLLLSACERVNEPVAKNAETEKLVKQYVFDTAPKVQHQLDVNMAGQIEIIGYDLEPAQPVKGRFFSISLYYKVLDKVTRDWMFFGHLEPVSGGQYRVRLDHKPVYGRFLPTMWPKGKIVKDTFRLRLPADFPGEKGRLWMGFYVEDPGKSDVENRLKPLNPSQGDEEYRVNGGVVTIKPGEPVKPKEYIAYRTADTIKIDGELDENSWKRASTTGQFVDSYGVRRKDYPGTQARLLYDNKNLYVAFICQDTDLLSSYTKKDDPIYKEEAVEVMIDADNNGREYFELQVNPANIQFDKFFHEGPRRGEDLAWNSGMKTAVKVNGTVGKRSDTDVGWTVEMAIPFKDVFKGNKATPSVPPKDGDVWKVNLFRVDHSGKDNKGAYLMWNPVHSGDFHTLRNWGNLLFSKETVDKAPAEKPARNDIRKQLKNVDLKTGEKK